MKPRSISLLVALGMFMLAVPPAIPAASKVVMVYYMPWFSAKPDQAEWGWHWTMDRFNPNTTNSLGQRQIASWYYPLIGPYDSSDPAVLEYHRRSATPILNWYLYAYGIVTVCLFFGGRLLAPPRNIVAGSNVPPILAGFGTVLAFLLLNIEIADYFSAPGSTLAFQWGGNFAREMTYTIAWALYALVLLIYGIFKTSPAARYAAMGLLCVTLLKLFFHDLANLGQLYRIGAFIGVAVIAMLASFAYQKFFAAGSKQKEAQNETPQ